VIALTGAIRVEFRPPTGSTPWHQEEASSLPLDLI